MNDRERQLVCAALHFIRLKAKHRVFTDQPAKPSTSTLLRRAASSIAGIGRISFISSKPGPDLFFNSYFQTTSRRFAKAFEESGVEESGVEINLNATRYPKDYRAPSAEEMRGVMWRFGEEQLTKALLRIEEDEVVEKRIEIAKRLAKTSTFPVGEVIWHLFKTEDDEEQVREDIERASQLNVSLDEIRHIRSLET